MIFVTVGSQKFSFDRLLTKVDQMAGEHMLTEEVYMQTGNSTFEPRHCHYQQFYDRDKFAEMVEKCSILITHGGVGIVVDAVRQVTDIDIEEGLAKTKTLNENLLEAQLTVAI